MEDHTKDIVTLSVAREQALELPGEDLADALEVLSGDEQQAMFSALDPDGRRSAGRSRTPRQTAAHRLLSEEKAPPGAGHNVRAANGRFLLQFASRKSRRTDETVAATGHARQRHHVQHRRAGGDIDERKIFRVHAEAKAADVLHSLRNFAGDNRNIAYLYIVAGEGKTLQGVVDLRDLVVAPENASLGELMISPVVTADHDCLREDLVALFAKYQFHMLPVVDAQDRLLGIVRNRDILKGTKFEPKGIDLCPASKQHERSGLPCGPCGFTCCSC